MDPQETQSLQSQIDELKNAPVLDHNLDPQTESIINNKLDLTPGTAFGDIFYVSASGEIKRLSPGTSGYFLKTLGVGSAPVWANAFKFGGNGSDGALIITSGTTTINLAGAAAYTGNFTSISITGTGKLAFSNPHANGTYITLRSQGNVTITSSASTPLDASGCGGAGGTGGAGGNNSAGADGTDGSNTGNAQDALTHYGNKGTRATHGAPGTAGTGGAVNFALTNVGVSYYTLSLLRLSERSLKLFIGSGGAGGGGGSAGSSGLGGAGGDGGRGGAALMIECAGAWNFTTANGISVAGTSGASGQDSDVNFNGGGGGGGGGSTGSFLCLYNTLTANSGTVNTSGGAGGSGGKGGINTAFDPGGGGGAGGSSLNLGGAGGNGGISGGAGSNGGNASVGAGGGGGGGAGENNSGSTRSNGGTGGTTSSDSNAYFINVNYFF